LAFIIYTFSKSPLTKIRAYGSLFKHERRRHSQITLRQADAGNCVSDGGGKGRAGSPHEPPKLRLFQSGPIVPNQA
jgi:hypothetical protein